MPTVVDERFTKDNTAHVLANKWVVWNANRTEWLKEHVELRQYIFATSTRSTTNKQLPWKNSTVTPKLTQIRDNLHANYMAALFPREDWFEWKGQDQSSTTKKKRDAIEAYMQTKLKASNFQVVVSQLILDYIDYGNVFAGHQYVCEKKVDPTTKEEVTVYEGPSLLRISPLDIVFDPTAVSFDKSPCIVRRIVSLGELDKMVKEHPELGYNPAVLDKVNGMRMAASDTTEALKSEGFKVDGFGSIELYFNSGMVELLDFHGDYYDTTTKTYHSDMRVTIVDRRWVLRQKPNDSWTGSRPIKHCGWRLRPDNLWSQGPLDQLVGMQYRIDHLENLKADVFDQIAHPVTIIKGETVEDFEFGPGATVHVGEDGGVSFDRPDAQAIHADMEIQTLMDRMEELAGAPRQAMGIRTPGEKTKYEVQVLENGAGRIFQSKVSWFERNIIEPILNSMLEECVRSMGPRESVRMVDPDYGSESFKDITKEDITAKGKLYPIGARHFAEQAMFVQELSQTLQLINQIPEIKAHISGKNIAKALEETLGWKSFGIVKDNALVSEQAETQRLVQAAQEQVGAEGAMPSELQDQDYVPRNTNEQPVDAMPPQGLQ
ncbi:Head-to-tail connector protein, podovirus-type [uncultured Caudovirales phage]|uniref:Head-to-tail connector protein, podovirus-type n=1 Tax=uncultured Caudovirales phage TaxID=2100421 RepID=A0A6J5QEY7_9CAUD|nr:Head-to-tail connector protein, podovirus-type [uncultured Caudovirales phage]CAB4182853.1 Head-to-tail connector protein, podovirus-type [uncultured Caudovirales phage]CAB4197290.1 Head-to-tail connector protein, podovirus-type [uncultured Caudovirales phage]CAB4212283.1 Head-to-tail connector protein, podovirus-type [uncultured Caudovirales phage]CAB5227434.1 Head-to-tail connector protein, podovirus-type [uncultured Caudovirales phage]